MNPHTKFPLSPLAMFASLWRNRSLIATLVKREVVGRYRGSIMGLAWSFFINVLNLPLLILMFVVEKAYRNWRYPDHPRTTIMQAIEVYAKDFAAPRKANSER